MDSSDFFQEKWLKWSIFVIFFKKTVQLTWIFCNLEIKNAIKIDFFNELLYFLCFFLSKLMHLTWIFVIFFIKNDKKIIFLTPALHFLQSDFLWSALVFARTDKIIV